MFDKLKDLKRQMELMQRLMKDENFRALISHPKVQSLLKDKEFQELVKTQDMGRIASNPKFQLLKNDPELAKLFAKINPQDFLKA